VVLGPRRFFRFNPLTAKDRVPRLKARIKLKPVRRNSYVMVRHLRMPSIHFKLMLPEYAYRDKKTNRGRTGENTVWRMNKDGTSGRFHWGITEQLKKERGVDFWGSVQVTRHGVAFTLSLKNLRDKPWKGGSLVCFRAGNSAPWVDRDARRTYVRDQGRLVTVNKAVKGKFPPHRMIWMRASDGLTARVSKDGKWVMAIATDMSPYHSFNFRRHMSCLHSNPGWGVMKPGQTKTTRGRVYIIKGTLEDVWRKYRADTRELK
jgi:hypothetical protein